MKPRKVAAMLIEHGAVKSYVAVLRRVASVYRMDVKELRALLAAECFVDQAYANRKFKLQGG